MKKFISIMLALTVLLLPLSGCTNTTDNVFTMSSVKPWNNDGINTEICVYDYEKTDASGNAVAYGTLTVTIRTSGETTTIDSRFEISNEGAVDSVYSSITCDSSTLRPKRLEKTVRNNVSENDGYTDKGYTMILDYESGKGSFDFSDPDADEKDDLTLPSDMSDNTFDSDQYYYIVRSANNLTAENNSGMFNLYSGTDSFIVEKNITFPMKYIVGKEQVVDCKKLAGKFGISESGKVLCRTVNAQINATQSGSTTTLLLASAAFGNDTSEGRTPSGRNVIISISRPQYSVRESKLEYTHKYTLAEYRAF